MKKDSLSNDKVTHIKKGTLEYIQFNKLKEYDNLVTHCFTTRKGGVSTGECSTLNMGFNRKDLRDNVLENYRIIANELNVDYKKMVFSNQVHDNRIRIVKEGDCGKGITRESDIIGFDGLVTNNKEVVLVTFYADCVPLFFLDPLKEVIGLSHSGWRSSVKGIGKETVKLMQSEFGCNKKDIIVGIGPSISKCCFEVGEEVYNDFIAQYPWCESYCIKTGEDKFHLDLQSIIKESLIESGIDREKISISGLCTKCNKDTFFSHRGDMGKTGSLAAIMMLKNK